MDGKITCDMDLGAIPLRTLEDLVKVRRDMWALCLRCGHAERVQTKKLVLKIGFVTLEEARAKLLCWRCKVRGTAFLVPEPNPWPER